MIQSHHLWTRFQACGWCALWDGSRGGGFPAFAETLGSPLHPLVILTTWWFGVIDGDKLSLVGAIFLGGIAQWWLGRELGVGWLPRMWGACMAIVAGHLAGKIENGNFGLVLAMAMAALTVAPSLWLARTGSYRAMVALAVNVMAPKQSRAFPIVEVVMSKKLGRRKNNLGSLAAGTAGVLSLPLALAGGWIAYSSLAIDHQVPLYKAIDAEWRTFISERSGALTFYVDRHASGRPLVLLHSINAAGSSYEKRPLFEHFRRVRPVFALDLPGFGFSERSDRTYSPRLYEDAILDFIETEIGEPVDVVALSLSSEFAARAALAQPDRFHSLAMISPSGLTARGETRGSQRASANQTSGRLYRLLAFPFWAQAFYDLVATRASIHYFLQQSFVGPVDPGLESYSYATAHQDGARYAPLYFVSGRLFTRDVCSNVYERLKLPVRVIYDRDAFVRFDLLPYVLGHHPNWSAVRIIPSNGLPQFEKLDETVAALDDFWKM